MPFDRSLSSIVLGGPAEHLGHGALENDGYLPPITLVPQSRVATLKNSSENGPSLRDIAHKADSKIAGHDSGGSTSGSHRAPLTLSADDRRTLHRWIRAATSPQRLVMRSRIVLLTADGVSDARIADQLGVHRQTVRLWRRRFERHGRQSLPNDAPGRGRKRRVVGRG